jgi:predicted RNase H-like HicB family nuclease
MTERRYVIVIEGAEGEDDSAYAPNLPGCVATGATIEEVECEMHDAIAFHFEGLRDARDPSPSRPTSPLRTSTSPPDAATPKRGGVPTTSPLAREGLKSNNGHAVSRTLWTRIHAARFRNGCGTASGR